MKKLSPATPFTIPSGQTIGAYEISNTDKTPPENDTPSFMESGSAIVTENPLFMYVRNTLGSIQTASELDENKLNRFNPLDEQNRSQVDPEYWPEISTISTRGAFYRKIIEIQDRQAVQRIREKGSTLSNLTWDIANGFTNPLYLLIPGAAPLSKLSKVTAGSVAKHLATKTIPLGVAGAIPDEAYQFYNNNRTAQEAVNNAVMSGIFAGALAGGVSVARTLTDKTYKHMLNEMFTSDMTKFKLNKDFTEVEGFTSVDSSMGSHVDETRTYNLENESIYGWGKNGKPTPAALLIWMGAKWFRNPILMGHISKSASVRGFTNDMLQHNLDLTGHVKHGEKFSDGVNGSRKTGTQDALQTRIAVRQKASLEFQVDFLEAYYKHITVDSSQNFVTKHFATKKAVKSGMDNTNVFSKKVYKAIVEGGIDKAHPEVATFAKHAIDKYLNPLYEQLVELGELPPNLTPKMAMQHVMRVFDRDFVAANRQRVTDFFTDKFSKTNEAIAKISQPLWQLKDGLKQFKKEYSKTKRANKKNGASTSQMADAETAFKKGLEDFESNKLKLEGEIEAKIKNKDPSITDDMVVWSKKNKRYQLRKYYEFEDDLEAAAIETVQTIESLTEDQMSDRIHGVLTTGAATNTFNRRVLMVPDTDMIDVGILNGDIRATFGAYNLRMSRLIEMKKFTNSRKMQAYGHLPPSKLKEKMEGKPLDFLVEQIRKDYTELENNLQAKRSAVAEDLDGEALRKSEEKYGKKAIKLRKQLERDVDTVTTIYNRLMGKANPKYGDFLRYTNAIKKFFYSTELGAMVLLQAQDLVSPMFRQGFSRYFFQGILPYARNLAALDFKSNKRLRNAAKDIGLANETMLAYYNNNFAYDRPSFVPLTFVEKSTDFLANSMGILNGSSMMSDLCQSFAATSSQSSIIRDLKTHISGKLSKKDTARLLNLRINPSSDVAKEIVKLAEKYGGKRRGAYEPNFHLWDIKTPLQREARSVFQGAVMKDVQSVLFSGGNIASFPIDGSPNGMLGSFLMYMGWCLNAFSNITIPLAQKVDMRRITTAALMVSVASMVEPMRKLAQGDELKEEDLEFGTMTKNGVLNSGILGSFGHLMNLANAAGDIVPSARINRFKNTRGVIQFGPERLVADFLNVLGMVANSEYNKKDTKRIIKNIPLYGGLIYTRAFNNSLIDKLDIPETRHKASLLKEWK